VSDPLRSLPVFLVKLNVTVPSPVPLAPDVTVIQASLLLAVHAQVLPVDTLTVDVPAAEPTSRLFGEIEYEHGMTAACVTVKVCPAIASVPFREPALFAATRNPTEPLPVPELPEVIVTHEALLAAVHAHPAVVVTFTLPVPPDTGTFWLFGEIE
jgi:hypothetical protein